MEPPQRIFKKRVVSPPRRIFKKTVIHPYPVVVPVEVPIPPRRSLPREEEIPLPPPREEIIIKKVINIKTTPSPKGPTPPTRSLERIRRAPSPPRREAPIKVIPLTKAFNPNYEDLTLNQLQDEARSRGLLTRGAAEDIIKRLKLNDKAMLNR